ncbi:MAG: iron ABC transporter permease [Oscillospiraceae bacterium]|nr:iron ABC transporter permease [Oscillospiraceae bacterium]
MYKEKITSRKGYAFFIAALVLVLVVLVLFSFYLGRFSRIKLSSIPKILLNEILPVFEKTWTKVDESVVLNLRFPRIIASIVVGASLAISGAVYQALFSNPVASSDSLGVSSSAAFGAVLGFLLNLNIVSVKVLSFLVGCAAVFSIYVIASRINNRKNVTVFLILIGMVISSLFSAMLSVLKYIADPIDQLPKITYWLMGSMSNVRLSDISYCVLLFLVGAVPLFLLRWRLNLLSLSDAEAKSIGENINLLRFLTIICATLLTSSAVAMTGGINWIGLVIPHIARLLVGNDSRKLLPASSLLGAIFLLAMDDMARSISVYELPISILTSLFGAPVFFAILIWRRKQIVDEN